MTWSNYRLNSMSIIVSAYLTRFEREDDSRMSFIWSDQLNAQVDFMVPCRDKCGTTVGV